MLPVVWIVAALMGLRLIGELLLLTLNRNEVRRHATTPPAAASAIMDNATYSKSVAYTLEKSQFAVITEVFDTLVLALVLLGGVLPPLFAKVAAWGAPGTTWSHALFILIAGALLSLPA